MVRTVTRNRRYECRDSHAAEKEDSGKCAARPERRRSFAVRSESLKGGGEAGKGRGR